MSLESACQFFYEAVCGLASRPEPIQQRLGLSLLSLAYVTDNDLPDDLMDRFRVIRGQMEKSNVEASPAASPRINITDEDAGKIATEIVNIYNAVCQRKRS